MARSPILPRVPPSLHTNHLGPYQLGCNTHSSGGMNLDTSRAGIVAGGYNKLATTMPVHNHQAYNVSSNKHANVFGLLTRRWGLMFCAQPNGHTYIQSGQYISALPSLSPLSTLSPLSSLSPLSGLSAFF